MILTEMINLAAEIAEQLLVAKDNDSEGLLPRTKLDIIRLAELAATMPDLPEEPECSPEETDACEAMPETDSETGSEPEPEPKPEPETVQAASIPADETPAPEAAETDGATGLVAAQLRRMFSLNDLFLFRRELFQGSQVLFDRALEDVGASSSAQQAREILVNNYAIDPKRPEAKEFLAVISGLFEI
ncbi:MAG: hypothetical protein K2G30_05405 [Muribaculaceae bacterium]|nr:hypothetical protein [Muribaculaceae bacterium]